MFRDDLDDLYSKDLTEEVEWALVDSAIPVQKITSMDEIPKSTVNPTIVSIGYKETFEKVCKRTRASIVQTDGCSRKEMDEVLVLNGNAGKRRCYVVRPTLDPETLAKYAYLAVATCYEHVRKHTPQGIRKRLAGFRRRILKELQGMDRQFRFLEGDNIGAWYSVEEATKAASAVEGAIE